MSSPRGRSIRAYAGTPPRIWVSPARWLAAAALLTIGPLMVPTAGAQAAEIYHVDRQDSACSDAGPGTAATPYCSIGAAIAAHRGPGVTLLVHPGVYREQVTVPLSGDAADPFVIRATGPGTVIDGSDDFSDSSRWSPVSGDVWLAAAASWSPAQVIVDGRRLAASSVDPSTLPAGSFRYVAGTGLYVNAGGSPGALQTFVSRRPNGFRISGKSWIVIDGFTVTRTQERAVHLSTAANDCVVRNLAVQFAAQSGLYISECARLTLASNLVSDVADHGIYLTNVSQSTIEDNLSCRSVKPGDVSASGIYVTGGSTGNVIRRNRLHTNRGSGLRIGSSSSDNLCVQNLSWANRENGFDHSAAPGTRHIGSVAWQNLLSGFTIRSASTGVRIHDCIAVDNGLAGSGYDLIVDSTSVAGFVSDYNLFWNSTSRPPLSWRATAYTAVSAYAVASGQDAHSIQADPRFVDPAAGLFQLRPGSPAIDAATSAVADWPEFDAEGRARFDDPSTANSGDGPTPHADRGALEFSFDGIPPAAALHVAPDTGEAPLQVTADASASIDTDGIVVSYRFDFGDGSNAGPQAEPTATHTYSQGNWIARVVVTDDDGLTHAASSPVTVAGPNHAPQGVVDAPAKDATISAGQGVRFAASGSDDDGPAPLTYHWDFGGGAADLSVEDPGAVVFATPGTYTVRLTVTDGAGLSDPTPASRVVTVRTPVPGIVADEIHWTFTGQTAVTFDWRGSADSIRYGLTPDYDRVAKGVPPVPYPFSSGGPFWEARIDGLTEDTVFHYSIGGGPDHTFRTPPPRGGSGFALYAEGDIGSTLRYPRVADIQEMIAAGRPDFCLLLGDLTYGNDHGQAAVDQHFNDMMAWSQDAAYMPTWGNHDWESPDHLDNYKGRFELPNPRRSPGTPAISDVGEDWYWFDHGNVRFIAYPEPWTGAFSDWNSRADSLMDAAEADTAIDFVVTYGHRPAYSSGHHSGHGSLKNYLDALGDAHRKYVLNLSGHSHSYERTHRQHGVVHVVAGTGGSSLESADDAGCMWAGGCPPPPWIAFRAMHYVAFRLDVTDGMIRGRAFCGPAGNASNPSDIVCAESTVIDSFTIVPRLNEAPVVTAPATVRAASGAALTVTVQAADPDDDAIVSLTADLSSLPAGHGAAFTAAPDRRSGTLTWTPAIGHAGGPYAVNFVAANGLADTAATSITVFANHPPAAALSLGPPGGDAPLTVFVNASSSTDPDGDSLSYRFRFGDGTEAGPQAQAIAAHNFAPGNWNVSVIVTDAHGAADTASAPLTVLGNLVTNSSFETSTQGWISNGPGAIARVAGGRTGGFALQVAAADTMAQFGVNDSPNWIAQTASAGTRYRFSAWVRSDFDTGKVRLKIREYRNGIQQGPTRYSAPITLSPQWGMLGADHVTLANGSTIDLQVIDTPARRRETFRVDDVNASLAPSDTLPPNLPPDAALAATPAIGAAPMTVTATASASTDPEGGPLSYRFDFGDGTVVGPQAAPSAFHDYAAGDWILTLTVTDAQGASDTSSTPVTVRANLVKNPSFESSTTGWNASGTGAAIARIAGGRHGSFAAEVRGPATRGTFGINDAPNWVSPHAGPGARYRFTAWVRSDSHSGKAYVRVREFLNGVPVGAILTSPPLTLTPAWQMLALDAAATVAGGTLDFQIMDTPIANSEIFRVDEVSAILLPGFVPANRPPSAALAVQPAIGVAPLAVTADASASSDPDGGALSYRFDFGDGTVIGPQAGPIASHTYATGSWTLGVIVTDDRGASDTTSTPVTAAVNLVRNPSFESSTSGWNAYGNGAPSIARVAGGHDGAFCVEARAGTGITTFGLNDAPNWISPHAGVRSRYRFTAWVRSQSHAGKAWIRVREFLNGVGQGAVIASPMVVLSPAWQMVSVEAVANVLGGTLDMQVVDNPVVAGEVFQIDEVVAYLVPGTITSIAVGSAPESSHGAPRSDLRFAARLSPNPPGPTATLEFSTTRAGFARVRIHDAQGRLVRALLDEPALPPGRHTLRIETRAQGSRLGPGMYFYSVQAAEGRLGGKFVVLE